MPESKLIDVDFPRSDNHLFVKSLQDKDFRQQQMVQNLAAALYTCDALGYVKFYNKAAAELWGREPEIGKDLWCGSWKIYRLDGTRMPFDECPMALALKGGKSIRGQEIVVERPDGIRRNIMPYPDPIFNAAGEVVEAVNMLVDITDLKLKELAIRQSEEKFKQIAGELEIRVNERTKELLSANAELKQINEELEEFAFIASHDMQEPLRKIKTFARRLEEKSSVQVDEHGRTLLQKIKDSSARMTGQINDLLNYARIAHAEAKFERVDLNGLIDNMLTDFEVSIEEKNAVIHRNALPAIQGIPLQMRQLFYNLFANSLKFCKSEIPCEIRITSRKLSGEEINQSGLHPGPDYCEIKFADNGIGFDQAFSENIFRIFERLNTRNQYEGTGIGLALCRKIISKHRGKIFATSSISEGTVIHILLPIA